MDAVLGHLVVPDDENLEQPAQDRDLRRGGGKGGGQVQPAHQHHKAGRGGHGALAHMAERGGSAAAGLPLPDSRLDPIVEFLRDGNRLVRRFRSLKFLH